MKVNRDIKMKKSTFEFAMLVALFIFSFINPITTLLFLIGLSFLFTQKEVGALKIVFLLTLRTIINPGIAVSIGSYEMIKLALLSIASLFLVISFIRLRGIRFRGPLFTLVLFLLFNVFVAFYSSSLPIVATLKAGSFTLVYMGVLTGVSLVVNKFDIVGWVLKWLKIIVTASLFSFFSPVSYLRNGRGFQGILNHPNMFGIVSVLFIAMLLGHKNEKGNNFFVVISMLMIVLSESRTSLISSFLVFILFLFDNYKFKLTKLKVLIFSFVGIVILLSYEEITSFFLDFIAKGQNLDNFLYSRQNQVNSLMYNFQQRPLLGNGFSVPVLPYRSFDFSMEYLVEPGNIILAVLSFSGIIGFLIFTWHMGSVLFYNKNNFKNKLYLFVAPLLINMGEMVFFSSNNIGVLCYLALAMYMFYEPTYEAVTENEKLLYKDEILTS